MPPHGTSPSQRPFSAGLPPPAIRTHNETRIKLNILLTESFRYHAARIPCDDAAQHRELKLRWADLSRQMEETLAAAPLNVPSDDVYSRLKCQLSSVLMWTDKERSPLRFAQTSEATLAEIADCHARRLAMVPPGALFMTASSSSDDDSDDEHSSKKATHVVA